MPEPPPPPFGLEVGERRTLTGIDVMAASPLSSADAVSRLDELADELSAGVGAGLALLVTAETPITPRPWRTPSAWPC